MAAIELLYGESTFLRLIPATLTEGKISGLGAKADFLRIVTAKSVFASGNADTGTQYFTTEASNNNRYSRLDKSKNYNVITGETIADEGGADAKDKFECEVLVTPSQRSLLKSYFKDGTPVFGIRDIGKKSTTETDAGYEYIVGKITDFTDSPERGPSKCTFSISASDSIEFKKTEDLPDIDEADFNAVATGAANTIQPDNEAEKTITALVAGDWTDIMVGKIVTKLVA